MFKRLLFFAYGVASLPDLPRDVPLRHRLRRRVRRADAASMARLEDVVPTALADRLRAARRSSPFSTA